MASVTCDPRGRQVGGRLSARLRSVMAALAATHRDARVIEPRYLIPARNAGMARIARRGRCDMPSRHRHRSHGIGAMAGLAHASRNRDVVEAHRRPAGGLVAHRTRFACLNVGCRFGRGLDPAAACVTTRAVLRRALEYPLDVAGVAAR